MSGGTFTAMPVGTTCLEGSAGRPGPLGRVKRGRSIVLMASLISVANVCPFAWTAQEVS